MTARGGDCYGPTRDDEDAYGFGGTNYQIVTHLSRSRFKLVGGGSGITMLTVELRAHGPAFSKAWRWSVGAIVLEANNLLTYKSTIVLLAFGGEAISHKHAIAAEVVTDTTFKLALGELPVLATFSQRGSDSFTTFTQNTVLTYRYETNGTDEKLWIDSGSGLVLEITNALTDRHPFGFNPLSGWRDDNALATGQNAYHADLATREGDAESDRPDVSPTFSWSDPDGDTSEDDAGSESDCADGLGDANKWDDWQANGSADEDTTFNCFDSAAERKQVSTLDADVALTGNFTTLCVNAHIRQRAATGDKIANWDVRFRDDLANVRSVGMPEQDVGAYEIHFAICEPAPSGTWTDYLSSSIFNHASSTRKLEGGIRTPAANDVNIRTTAWGLEVCALGDDPPDVTRRRMMGQVV